MEFDQAMEILKKTVKPNGVNGNKHIDLNLVSVDEKPIYEKALIIAKLAIMEGKLTQDEFLGRLHLDN